MPSTFPVTCHTNCVGKGTTFVVIKGLHQDGMLYVPLALERGALEIVIEEGMHVSEEIKQLCVQHGATISYVQNTRKALAQLSAQAAGYPAEKLKLYGVTGTKGKTTSVWMWYHILLQQNSAVALISTVGNYIGDIKFETHMTTPQPDYIHQFFKLCVEQKIEYVVMEVAAQATTFFRLETLEFDTFIFTNLEREHGELYPTMDEYFEAKRKIIDYVKGSLIINIDNQYGAQLYTMYPDATPYSFKDNLVEYFFEYVPKRTENHLVLHDTAFIYNQFLGLFNAYNLAAVIIACKENGSNISHLMLNQYISIIPPVPGRMEQYTVYTGATVIIDYAHTPSSFEALFSTLFVYNKKLIIIFGAGGGKDRSKRPIMGSIAAKYAHRIYITNDNPRFEDPVDIAQHIFLGIPEDKHSLVSIELDRKKAIENAISESDSHTIILVLGKGPDEYQIVAGEKLFFSDRLIAIQHQL